MISISNIIEVTKTCLVVEPKGLDKLWSVKRKITIPIDHVMGATIDNDIIKYKTGLKIPGTKWFNKISGTFIKDGQKSFWNVNLKEKVLVIQLKNEKYSRLMLGIDNNFDENYLNNLN